MSIFLFPGISCPRENEHLVNICWNIPEINASYEEFINEYSKKFVLDKSKIMNGQMSDAECFVERTKLVHEYRKFLFIDPGLPEELLTDEWLGRHAAALFTDYYKILAEPANRFFESIFAKDNEINRKDEQYEVLQHPYMPEA